MSKAGDILRAYEEELAGKFYLEMHNELTKRGFKCEPKDGIPNYTTNCSRSIEMECYNEALSNLETYVDHDESLNKWNRINLTSRIRLKRYSHWDILSQLKRETKAI
jgi:hypothetical protein